VENYEAIDLPHNPQQNAYFAQKTLVLSKFKISEIFEKIAGVRRRATEV
jgi:hypothetical protein